MFNSQWSMFNVQCSTFNVKESTAPVSRVLCRHCCRCLPFIYCARRHAPLAFYPPSQPKLSGGQPLLSMVYMNLQPPAGTARRSPAAWWSLTHTFSPLPRHFRKEAGRLFSSPLTSRRRLLLLSEVERPVLPGLSSRPTFQKGQRQTAAVLSVLQRYERVLE